MKLTVNQNFSQSLCVPCIQQRQGTIHRWLLTHEQRYTPFYTSVDIRDAGFKIAVVDTNLFPAGFNNLCEHGLADAEGLIKKAILARVPDAASILIVAEEHTRNTWYLENVRILQEIITKAGFNAQIASFFIQEPSFCAQAASAIEMETASGQTVKIHCVKRVLEKIKQGDINFDMIIMNNDLSAGIPEELKQVKIPVFPSILAGWHTRLKSGHFQRANNLIREFAGIVGLDPWQFSCLYEVENHVNINAEDDQKRLYQAAVKLFENIQNKYHEHAIDSKPFIFVKSDSGTYGLGVVPIEDPAQILELNRKKRNDLSRGKDAQTITHFLLQEGVPTIHRIEENPCEVCLYQIDNNFVGGFYRYHTGKSPRENLNSPGGMSFQKMCPHLDKYGGDCGIAHNLNIFDIYRILGRIAGTAAGQEIMDLKANTAKGPA
ncbi:MAG: glutamate--cysteine ligase [Candidatus Omnitrophica bacterium]|nr:glutamate--cysteine ligase [Candidatus Omnitrophota bacterium]MDE2009011.1 glutamate--cysteine ligase [Candidatus Omnitrophota bacterium]MDE2214535.1 glutamate--cysteine ligase [Candidatus Omnitrophota bacterium]MDE2230853.1 glutamate--cysteine ligase [Candidatus Omnitrophota bacterium]